MTILVTGASSGIGRAVSCALAELGHDVIAVARTLHLLESLKQQYPDHIHVIATDIATPAGCDEIFDYIKTRTSLNGIVHAAGSKVEPQSYRDLEVSTILQDMNIHVMTPILINNKLKNKLKGGRVVYIDSYSAIAPRTGWAGYSIVKAAAQMAARAATAEAEDYKVIRVFPGAVRTPLVEAVLNSKQQSATVDLFKELDSSDHITEPDLIGAFVTNILVSASDSQLDERESWDFNKSEDQIFETG